MSHPLFARSPDLQRLRNDGYDVEVRSTYLLVHGVPYVNATKEVTYGTLVSALTLAGDVAVQPKTHVAMFTGDHPCNPDGTKIAEITHQSTTKQLVEGLVVQHSFSAKPPDGKYRDYHHKMTTYVRILQGPAQAIDPSVTAQTHPVVATDEGESVFWYLDTATSRADIGMVTKKLELGSVGIVGLGGTGGYVLDLIAKTPIRAIHLFDGDVYLSHNAFRSPGAPSIEELREQPMKVDYLRGVYSRMHRNIVPHPVFVTEANVVELRELEFVFLCIDAGPAKQLIVEKLQEFGCRFIDVGMGIELVDGSLLGQLRVSTSTPELRGSNQQIHEIPVAGADGDDEYGSNIQIADLNCLNAALAVVKWKKLFKFYCDLENEHHSVYSIATNKVINEDLL